MTDLLIASVLIAATVGLICMIRLFVSGKKSACSRPSAELVIYFDENCGCLEYILGRIYSCSALNDLDLKVIVFDAVGTEESAEWLEALKRKIKQDFTVILEEERDGRKEHGYNKRNR